MHVGYELAITISYPTTASGIVTALPVAQPSYKLGSVFLSGANRTLACSARAQDVSLA